MHDLRRLAHLRLELLEDRTVPNGGRLDRSFGGDGTVTIVPSYAAETEEVLIQTDGKVVLVGWTSPGSYGVPTLARLTPEGLPDPTFGTAGVITFALPGGYGEFTGAALTATGEIIATGVYRLPDQDNSVIVARFLSDGGLDPTFGGGDGVVLTPFPGLAGFATPAPVAVLPDGRAVVAVRPWSSSTGEWQVLRYTVSGDLDPSFSGDGRAIIDFGQVRGDQPQAVRIQPDGKVVVAGAVGGFFSSAPGLARLNPDGTPDLTFGDNGRVVSTVPGDQGAAGRDLLVLPGGKLLVIASTGALLNDGQDLTMFQYNPDGSPDSTFDGDGIVVVSDLPIRFTPFAGAQQADGLIVMAGYCFNNFGGRQLESFIARFTPDGLLDPSFGPAVSNTLPGIVITDIGLGGNDYFQAVTLQADGRIVAAGATGSALLAARYFAGEDPNPHPEADAYQTDEGTPLPVDAPGLLVNDTLPPTGASAVLAQGAAHGVVTLNADGSFTYATSSTNYNGPDSFTYRLSGAGTSDETATVRLTVRPVNDAPVAFDGNYSTNEDTPRNGAATATDVDGDTLTYSLVSEASHGTVTISANGTFVYTPAANYNGSDTFTFRANDGMADSNIGTVTLTVTPVNDAPVASNGSGTTSVDTPLIGAITATDVDNESLTYSVVSGPTHGSLSSLNVSTGEFTYTPADSYYGPDSFTFKANDGTVDSNVATFSIKVNAAPVAVADRYTLPALGPLSVPAGTGVLADDTDLDGDALTAVLVDPPATGTLTLNPDGSFTYAFPEDFFGSVTFTYAASDDSTTSPPVPVTLRRGSSVTVNGGTVAIVGSPGVDFVRLRRGLGNAIRVEMYTPDGITRTTLKPLPGVRRFTLVDVYLADGDDRLDAAGLTVPVRAVGGAGNDFLRTGAGADFVFGDLADGNGAGDDVIESAFGNDRIVAGDGHDLIDAGLGHDTVTAGSGGSFIDAGGGNDFVTAAGGANWIIGGSGRDVLVGGDGNDLLDGGLGNDLLAGGLGADIVDGGAGNDLLFDGAVAVKDLATDSLAKVLASYVPSRRSSLVNITGRIDVTFDTIAVDDLQGGLGIDWFWSNDLLDVTDRRPTEPLNAIM